MTTADLRTHRTVRGPSPAEPASPTSPATRSRHRPGRADGAVLAAVFAVLYAVLAVSRWARYETMSWDLGIFVQVVDSYAQVRAPEADLKGPGFDILGDHFSPVLALLAPFYRLWPGPATLLIAQSALLGWSVHPVTSAAARLLGRRTGLLIGTAYGMSWGLQKAADFDFHEIAFAVPLLAASLAATVTGRWRAALLWALPLVLVKEDLGLTCAAVAAVVAWRCRRDSPRHVLPAVAAACAGVLFCLVVMTVVIPAVNPQGYDYWSKIGTGSGPLSDVLLDGGEEKLRTLLWTLVPTTGLVALRSPLLVAALPTLAWRMLSHDEHYWSTDWHYSAVLMPVTTLALVDALPRLRAARRPVVRAYARHLPAAAAAAALALGTSLPFAALTEPDTYRTGAHAAAGRRVLAVVPDGASVEADIVPSAHLADRCRLFWVGNTRGIVPDYIALHDPARDSAAVLAYAKELHPGARYTVAAGASGYWVLRRVSR
ncbi:DUF2079 domain-containing protein [Streptomyces sp. NPDC093094]|uniref:DUF2079 domain-containing protein n=1 Tax=Streptomyces sp. NPDC093094 TaxID=3366026 RepID=UPI00382D7708